MSVVLSRLVLISSSISIAVNQQYIYYTDGVSIYRKGVRDSSFVIDKTLTETGFDGIENTDWENIYNIE